MNGPKGDIIQSAFEYACEDRRHYDNLIWNTISIALAVNAFLVGTALDTSSIGRFVVVAHLFVATFFMAVFYMALTKHRLFLRERERWRDELERKLELSDTLKKLNRNDLSRLDYVANAEWPWMAELGRTWRLHCAGRSAFRWLCSLVFLSACMDLSVAVYVACCHPAPWFGFTTALPH